jgi:hypothetical protein
MYAGHVKCSQTILLLLNTICCVTHDGTEFIIKKKDHGNLLKIFRMFTWCRAIIVFFEGVYRVFPITNCKNVNAKRDKLDYARICKYILYEKFVFIKN